MFHDLDTNRKQQHDSLNMKFYSSFSLLNFRPQSSLHLTQESAVFIWYRLLSRLVKDVQSDHRAMNSTDNSLDIFNKIKKYIAKDDDSWALDEFQKQYSPTNAVYWYTKNLFIYRLLNQAIRTRNIDILYTLKSLIIDLQTQLTQLFTAATKKLVSSTITLYRGARIRSDELEQLKANTGSFISLNTFMSTSRDKDIALTYAEAYSSAENDSNIYPIIYEIQCSLGIHSAVFADVEKYGTNINEKEVLFDFSTVFEITSVESKDDVWTVKLCDTNKHTQLVDNYVDVAKQEMKENSSELLFGRLLLYLGEYETAVTYVKQIAPFLHTKDKCESLARFCFDIGRRCHLNGDIDFALETYNSTLQYSTNLTLVARTLYTIGNMYFERNDYERALNYYQQILENEKAFPNGDSLSSAVYTTMGMIYQSTEEYEKALYHYRKAMEIDSRQDSVSLASSMDNIASVYEQMNNYNVALDYYINAQKIRLKVVPTNHLSIATSFLNLASLYTLVGEKKLALECYLKVLYIQKVNLQDNHPDVNETIAKISRLGFNEGKVNF
jgi:tetratricopeptide (TPR) repeat protein